MSDDLDGLPITERLDRLREMRDELDRVQQLVTDDIRKAVPVARAEGMSGSEIGRRLGMSRQAVNRLYLRT